MWQRKTSNDKPKNLPTNIEDATPKYVHDRLADWDARIAAERAAQSGVIPETASAFEAKPLYLVEAEKRAEAEGRSLQSVLDEYAERLQRSNYPGPECFLPDEIMEYADAALSRERLEHAQGCPACSTLLSASQALDRAEREVRKAIRQEDEAGIPEPAFAPVGGVFSDASRWIPVLESWAAVVLLPAIVLLIAYLYFWRLDSSATRLTFVHSWIPWVVAVVMVLVTLLLTFSARRLRPVMRSVGAGLAVGIVAASFLVTNFRQSQANRDLAITYAQDRLESVCADSIQNRRSTGKFLETHQSGLFKLDTSVISSTQATYTLTGKELPGKVVCNVGIAGGDLKWEYGNIVSERVRLLAGTVHNTQEGATLKVADGKNYPLEIAKGAPHVATGAYVLGAIDLKTSAVRPVRVISRTSEEGSIASAPIADPNNN